MADRPSFQFYPAEWRNNAKLQRCSIEARGAWMDVLCLLHDSDEYGVLRWPLEDIAQAVRLPLRLLKELAAKGVLKGSDGLSDHYTYAPFHAGKHGATQTLVQADGGPCWFCSRFVKDEWKRHQRGKATRFTESNQPPKATPNPTPKGGIGERQGDGPSSASSSSIKQEAPAKAGSIELETFIANCQAKGEQAIPADDPVIAYAEGIGLPSEYLALAWSWFKSAMEGKRKKDWRAHFRNAVKGNWPKYWYGVEGGGWALTTAGKQAQRAAA